MPFLEGTPLQGGPMPPLLLAPSLHFLPLPTPTTSRPPHRMASSLSVSGSILSFLPSALLRQNPAFSSLPSSDLCFPVTFSRTFPLDTMVTDAAALLRPEEVSLPSSRLRPSSEWSSCGQVTPCVCVPCPSPHENFGSMEGGIFVCFVPCCGPGF